MARLPGVGGLYVLATLLVGCGHGYHFSDVQAVADRSGTVHVAATVYESAEGGGGVCRTEVVSIRSDGMERAGVKTFRLADRALFTDDSDALLLISPDRPNTPIARRTDGRWRRVSLSDGLLEEAEGWLDDILQVWETVYAKRTR